MHFRPLTRVARRTVDPERSERSERDDQLAREIALFDALEAQAGHVDDLIDEAFEAALAHLDLPKLGRVVALSEERDSVPF